MDVPRRSMASVRILLGSLTRAPFFISAIASFFIWRTFLTKLLLHSAFGGARTSLLAPGVGRERKLLLDQITQRQIGYKIPNGLTSFGSLEPDRDTPQRIRPFLIPKNVWGPFCPSNPENLVGSGSLARNLSRSSMPRRSKSTSTVSLRRLAMKRLEPSL